MPGGPEGCYGYGLLIVITASRNAGGFWRNHIIYIEDNANGAGRVFIRSGHAGINTWRMFTGELVNIIS